MACSYHSLNTSYVSEAMLSTRAAVIKHNCCLQGLDYFSENQGLDYFSEKDTSKSLKFNVVTIIIGTSLGT